MSIEKVTLSVVGPTSVHPEGDLTATIPVRFPSYAVVLNAAWFLAWAACESLLLVLLNSDPERARAMGPWYRPVLLAAFLAYTAAGVFLAWRILWEWIGREIVRIDSQSLVLRREIAGIGRSRTYPIWEVRDFQVGRFQEDPIYPLWSRLFVGKGPCFLSFRASGREVHFGRGLSEVDAHYLVDRIKHRR